MFIYRVTCGGKSSIGQKLIEKFPGSIIISQDDFFRVNLTNL